MMWRKWLSWLPEERENSGSAMASHAETEACREWTPFLTALFDGEADEDGALRARRHLLVCERCARAWMDWNQTRSLLINHSAPPPPPSLLWRIRLACRLGKPAPAAQSAEPPVPQLAAQILAQTSRKSAKPAPSFASRLVPVGGFRFNAPFMGALAMGAFLLFVTRDNLLVSPPPSPVVANTPKRTVQGNHALSHSEGRAALTQRAHRAGTASKVRLAAPHASDERDVEAEEEESRVVAVSAVRRSVRSQPVSSVLLERTRRERESLASSPIRLASFENEAEPLPMLPAPAPIEVKVEEPKPVRKPVRSPRLARLPRIAPGPVASAPRISSPVVLASFEEAPVAAAESTSTSSARSRRSSRAVLASASLPSAPLRISTPHALPIVVSQPSASDADDSGLDELDSAVQDYRASLADSDNSDFSSDAG